MSLACPSCGNEKIFQVKTLQLHLLEVGDLGLDVGEEGKPAVLELLCDECETAIELAEIDPETKRDVLLSLGARA